MLSADLDVDALAGRLPRRDGVYWVADAEFC